MTPEEIHKLSSMTKEQLRTHISHIQDQFRAEMYTKLDMLFKQKLLPKLYIDCVDGKHIESKHGPSAVELVANLTALSIWDYLHQRNKPDK